MKKGNTASLCSSQKLIPVSGIFGAIVVKEGLKKRVRLRGLSKGNELILKNEVISDSTFYLTGKSEAYRETHLVSIIARSHLENLKFFVSVEGGASHFCFCYVSRELELSCPLICRFDLVASLLLFFVNIILSQISLHQCGQVVKYRTLSD